MLIAVVSVSVLIAITLGLRESLIVFLAIPVTLALTLAVFYLYGYTLNRITLFALIFSIGILVDDAIVVVENIVRHWRMPANRDRPPYEVAIEAVDEVGNPTILATLTVVAAILPMAFVGGLMGPYMRPIPIGASAAMVFSLLVAFIVTPWAAVRILKPGTTHRTATGGLITRLYRRVMGSILHRAVCAGAFSAGVVSCCSARCSLVLLPVRQGQDAAVRQQERVPGDRRHAQRHDARRDRARHAMRWPTRRSNNREVVNLQTYVGHGVAVQLQRPGAPLLSAPRRQRRRHPGQPAAQEERELQSHEIAKQMRARLLPVANRFGARIKVAEVPPGPPVLETLVAEVYGPTQDGRIAHRPPDPRSVEANRRRRRCGLVRRGRSAEIPSARRSGKGRAERHLRGRHRAHHAGRVRGISRPVCCMSIPKRRTFR